MEKLLLEIVETTLGKFFILLCTFVGLVVVGRTLYVTTINTANRLWKARQKIAKFREIEKSIIRKRNQERKSFWLRIRTKFVLLIPVFIFLFVLLTIHMKKEGESIVYAAPTHSTKDFKYKFEDTEKKDLKEEVAKGNSEEEISEEGNVLEEKVSEEKQINSVPEVNEELAMSPPNANFSETYAEAEIAYDNMWKEINVVGKESLLIARFKSTDYLKASEGKYVYFESKAMKDLIAFAIEFKKTFKIPLVGKGYRTPWEQIVCLNNLEKEEEEYEKRLLKYEIEKKLNPSAKKPVRPAEVAPVYQSNHNYGLAFDINRSYIKSLSKKEKAKLNALAENFNFKNFCKEAWHFDHNSQIKRPKRCETLANKYFNDYKIVE